MMINKSPQFSKASTFYPWPYRQNCTVVNVVIELFDNSPHDPLWADVQPPLNPIHTGKGIELRSPTPIMAPALIQVNPIKKNQKSKNDPLFNDLTLPKACSISRHPAHFSEEAQQRWLDESQIWTLWWNSSNMPLPSAKITIYWVPA